MRKKRWDEILAVSARLFREKGYRATTMEDISNELKVTKPALYYYIDNKQDILYAICEAAIKQLVEGVEEIVSADMEVEEKFKELIFHHIKSFSKDGDITTVYLADESELPPDKRETIRSMSRRYEKLYREIISQAIKEGKFRKLDVPMTVRAISGMCNWLAAWYKPDGEKSAEEIAEIFFDLILKGCKKD